MEWYINDLSLDGQFPNSQAFCERLKEILKLRLKHSILRENLFCSRTLGQRPIAAAHNLQQILLKHPDPMFKRQVLEWVGKFGPFWEDSRANAENDYFTFGTTEVTEQGLGEACRCRLLGREVASFSFIHNDFACTPLNIQHGWREPELNFGRITVRNFWQLDDLITVIESLKPEPTSWGAMLQEAQQRFTGLILSKDIEAVLRSHPFNSLIIRRLFELLGVLQQLVEESDDHGGLSEAGKELLNQHFCGAKAWFSASSTTEERQFEQELAFTDPCDSSQTLFCSWHGKIKTPQYRIHFQWPRPKNQREIKVVYIGPKITKK